MSPSHVYSKAASTARRPRRRLLRGAWPFRLYLRRPAIDKQLDPSHKTGIVRRKKKCRRGDLMRLTDPTHRDDRYELVFHLLRNADEDAGVDRARADHIHANVPVFQVNRRLPTIGGSASGRPIRSLDSRWSRWGARAGGAGRTQRGGSGRPVLCETVFLRVRGCPLIEVEPAVNVAMR